MLFCMFIHPAAGYASSIASSFPHTCCELAASKSMHTHTLSRLCYAYYIPHMRLQSTQSLWNDIYHDSGGIMRGLSNRFPSLLPLSFFRSFDGQDNNNKQVSVLLLQFTLTCLLLYVLAVNVYCLELVHCPVCLFYCFVRIDRMEGWYFYSASTSSSHPSFVLPNQCKQMCWLNLHARFSLVVIRDHNAYLIIPSLLVLSSSTCPCHSASLVWWAVRWRRWLKMCCC